MLIVSFFSTLLIASNGITLDVNKVLHTPQSAHYSLLSFGMFDDGRIKDISFKTSEDKNNDIQFRLTKGPQQSMTDIVSFKPKESIQTEQTGKGLYYLFVEGIKDNDFNEGDIKIEGKIHIIHDYGELSPDQFRCYQYYSFALFLSLIMSIVWFVLMYKYKKTLVAHHYAIGLIIWILTIETLINYFKLMYVNNNGYDVIFMDHFGTQSQVIRQTLSRLFLILVSLGWGIISADSDFSEKMKRDLIKLGLLYYFGASILSHFMVEAVRKSDFDNLFWMMPIILIQCLLESIIFWTIIMNLNDVLLELKQGKQYSKYNHYKKFCISLIILMFIAAINVIFEWYIRNHIDEYFDFTILCQNCFWHFMFVLMIMIVMILWRPTKSSKFYAFVEQIPNNPVDIAIDVDIDIDQTTMEIAHNHDTNLPRFEIGGMNDTETEEEKYENEDEYEFADMNGDKVKYTLDLSVCSDN